MFRVLAFVFPSHHYGWWSPAFLGMAELLPAQGKLMMNFLLIYLHAWHFLCFLSLLHFQFSHPSEGDVSGQLSGAELPQHLQNYKWIIVGKIETVIYFHVDCKWGQT